MVQKHSSFSKFSRGSAPDPIPQLLDFQTTGPPQVHDHHHGFSFLANVPNISIETVIDHLSMMQLEVTKPILRLGVKPPPPQPKILQTWLDIIYICGNLLSVEIYLAFVLVYVCNRM